MLALLPRPPSMGRAMVPTMTVLGPTQPYIIVTTDFSRKVKAVCVIDDHMDLYIINMSG